MLMFLEFLFISGLIVFVSKRKHLLLMLLSLEFLVLVLFLNLFYFLVYLDYESFFSMIFLTMSVCEGVLGLSIMVNMIRTHGNDYIMTFTFLW
uniref:NADH-ubiquinone oxidoreductase chain 4L n=1 Tax=Palaestes scutellaris TaxID=2528288 RepID=A0A7G7MU14_9CUCU|nr:NADH dehydrogenase subunit 4L [Palaestes scutellaris]